MKSIVFVGNGRTLLTSKEIERDPNSITRLKNETWNRKVNQCSTFMKVPKCHMIDFKYSPDGKRLMTIGWGIRYRDPDPREGDLI
jgi:hypothetical protein